MDQVRVLFDQYLHLLERMRGDICCLALIDDGVGANSVLLDTHIPVHHSFFFVSLVDGMPFRCGCRLSSLAGCLNTEG
jgi:hypothetical protein